MVAQLSFNFESFLKSVEMTDIEAPKKRIRYDEPTYLKFYPIYQYDRELFKTMMKEWLNTKEGQNRTYSSLYKKQKEILELCYIRDEFGKIKYDDEPHIYRIKTLHNMYNEIYGYARFFKNTDKIIIDIEENEAYLDIQDINMSIKQKVIIHLRLLRLLRKGYSIKDSLLILAEKGKYQQLYYENRAKINERLRNGRQN